MEQLKNTFQLW